MGEECFGSCWWGGLVGVFDELAGFKVGAGADEGHGVGRIDRAGVGLAVTAGAWFEYQALFDLNRTAPARRT